MLLCVLLFGNDFAQKRVFSYRLLYGFVSVSVCVSLFGNDFEKKEYLYKGFYIGL